MLGTHKAAHTNPLPIPSRIFQVIRTLKLESKVRPR